MYPFRLIAILEESDPTFKELFFPVKLRCRLNKRTVQAIEEHWTVYFPKRKECRGKNWSFGIPDDEPLYQSDPTSVQELADWKKSIKGTIAELRLYGKHVTWKRFKAICQNSPRLNIWLKDFKPLMDFLIREESMWPVYDRGMIGQDGYYQGNLRALLGPGSPYHHADPDRLQFVQSDNPVPVKTRMIGLMHQLYDRPLMVLALLQASVDKSKHSFFWLPIQTHIHAIIKKRSHLTFRQTWLEHAMRIAGATKNGKVVPRKWAKMLVANSDPDLNVINAKAVEIHSWMHGGKRLSLKNVQRAGSIVFINSGLNSEQIETGKDLWLFSWMVTLWLEKHFEDVQAGFKKDVGHYYQRFFHYQGIVSQKRDKKGAGGLFSPPAL